MENERSGHTPGRYFAQTVPRSHDLGIHSKATGECVAQVQSDRSGHENAPDDRTAFQNANLLVNAPRMLALLTAIVEYPQRPLSPSHGEAVQDVLTRLAERDHKTILRARAAQEWQDAPARRIHAAKDQIYSKKLPPTFDQKRSSQTERNPQPTPGPYAIQAIGGSHDIAVFMDMSHCQVARVFSKSSGHQNAPPDAAALHNAVLFRVAPRMRDSLELLQERASKPVHPIVADGILQLLREVEVGAGEQIKEERSYFQEREDHGRRWRLLSFQTCRRRKGRRRTMNQDCP